MNVPKPGQHPTPDPTPGPTPGRSRGSGTPRVTTVAPSVTEARAHGRIDEDGVVWLATPATPEGERRVGDWQAGSVDEGYAHYARRFADLATEVEVLAARLTTHPEEFSRIRTDATRLRNGLGEAAVLGDTGRLDRRLADILAETDTVDNRMARIREDLVIEAEKLADTSTDWKATGDRLRGITDQWNAAGGDRAAGPELSSRLQTARTTFGDRRSAHFDNLDKQRDAVRRRKEDLVKQAVALQHSTDWSSTSRAYRDLMAEWKAAGRARRRDDDRLWTQFRGAQDVFFGARDADNRRKDKQYADNAEAKQRLLDDYGQRIDPAADLDRARALLRELQDEWDEIGFVPRERIAEFDEKIGELESRVSDYAEARWRRTDPEVEARVGQFQAKVDQLTEDADAAEKAGRTSQAADLRAQAYQWRQWVTAAAEAADDR